MDRMDLHDEQIDGLQVDTRALARELREIKGQIKMVGLAVASHEQTSRERIDKLESEILRLIAQGEDRKRETRKLARVVRSTGAWSVLALTFLNEEARGALIEVLRWIFS